METSKFNPIKRSGKSYRVERPSQTGFSSPATHYNEPRIDLNEVLVKNSSATFYVRVVDDTFKEFQIFENDVLIIDKSLTPTSNQLALVIQDDAFKIIRIGMNGYSEVNIWGSITYIIKSVL